MLKSHCQYFKKNKNQKTNPNPTNPKTKEKITTKTEKSVFRAGEAVTVRL